MLNARAPSHAEVNLVRIIRRSEAGLRQAVADLKVEPTKQLVNRVAEEVDVLSGAIAQLARVIDFDILENTPAPRGSGPDFLDIAERVLAVMEGRVCPTCGCPLPHHEEEPSTG